MMKKVFLFCIILCLTGCSFTRQFSVQESFFEFVPDTKGNTAQRDLEYLVYEYTDHLEDYHNKVVGDFKFTPIGDPNNQVFNVEWIVADNKNHNYDLKFKYIRKAGHIEATSDDAIWFMSYIN